MNRLKLFLELFRFHEEILLQNSKFAYWTMDTPKYVIILKALSGTAPSYHRAVTENADL